MRKTASADDLQEAPSADSAPGTFESVGASLSDEDAAGASDFWTDERIAAKRCDTLNELEWTVLLDELGREALERGEVSSQIADRSHGYINKYAALTTNWQFG